MSRKQTKEQIAQLKQQLKATNRASDARLLKLALVMALLALIAAVIYGKIPL